MERIAEIEKEERARLGGESGERQIEFAPGDTVKVHSKIVEGDKTRVQVFQGTVIGIHRNGLATTFTVRKTSYGVGVEKIFPLHSPWVEKVEVAMKGRVRRAKLYYLRERRGKASRIKEKREN